MDNLLKKRLVSWLKAGNTGFYLQSSEEERTDQLLTAFSRESGLVLREWNLAWGWVDFKTRRPVQELTQHAPGFETMLSGLVDDDPENTIYVFRNIRSVLAASPLAVVRLREFLMRLRRHHQGESCVVCIDEHAELSDLLEPLMKLIEIPLPQKDAIKSRACDFAKSHVLEVPEALLNRVSTTLTGLTFSQIDQSLMLALNIHGTLDEQAVSTLLKEKEQIIGKGGVLEMVRVRDSMEDIGGLENLKDWLKRKAAVFLRLAEAEEAGIQPPKGVLVAGMPGCGKSLTAKAVAGLFELPLLRLDIGSLLGKYVGESEHNMRRALGMAESISPCILWVDELEKAFVGIGSSNASEVTSRLLGYFLTWMQEKKSTVFVVATANNVTALPPELLRKGRFDEVFYVGFPYISERKEILRIHLKKAWDMLTTEQQHQLGSQSRNFAGADIHNAVNDARENAFLDGEDLDFQRLSRALKATVPLRETLRDQVSKYETLFDKMKLKAASHIDGLSVSQMIAKADDDNYVERLKVAENEECTEDLLEKLSEDTYAPVRLAVFKNPGCTQRLLSKCITGSESDDKKDQEILKAACVHQNAPANLLTSLIERKKLSKDIMLSIAEGEYCSAVVLDGLMAVKDSALNQAVLRHINCADSIRDEYVNSGTLALKNALASNPTLSEAHQNILIEDKRVRVSLARNASITELNKKRLAFDTDPAVVRAFEETLLNDSSEFECKSKDSKSDALLLEIKSTKPATLIEIASKINLPDIVQIKFAQTINNISALAEFARNPTLCLEAQDILAIKCGSTIRSILASNAHLDKKTQEHLFIEGDESIQEIIAENNSITESIQNRIIESGKRNLILSLAYNSNITRDACLAIFDMEDRRLHKVLSKNPALPESAQINYLNCEDNDADELRRGLSINPGISPVVFETLASNPDFHFLLLSNPSISSFDYSKIKSEFMGREVTDYNSHAHKLYMNNPNLPEFFQHYFIQSAQRNPYALKKIAANIGILPSSQDILVDSKVLDVLLNLIDNPSSTIRTIKTAKENITRNPKLSTELRDLYRSEIQNLENKRLSNQCKYTTSSKGLIIDPKTIEELNYNKGVQHNIDKLTNIRNLISELEIEKSEKASGFASMLWNKAR
ncbi:ATP-dependent zinc metalloprotease FtsH [Klebsiella spallanzanii]|uniref:Uncharacterized AAA domain-containing protein ycf46 n=2 Tax=Klebsiella spallanzanii TaxID=2587528 RepID=A0ABY6V889_9ENTR|nr:AAA family ATPase [Klebsiella spallanzanii]VUS26336.1 ATP-dependent zinc metalloprotease FtsH [Klebsiella spallanzanii]HEC2133139.1 AAA family ATPase [Klebsiella oxytoca]